MMSTPSSHAVACIVTTRDFERILNAHKGEYHLMRYQPPSVHIGVTAEIVFLKDGSAFIAASSYNRFYGYSCDNPEAFIDEKYINEMRPKPHVHIEFKD